MSPSKLKERSINVRTQYCPKNHPCPVAPRCPSGALKQANPFSAPTLDKTKCTSCGLCTRMCPVFECVGC